MKPTLRDYICTVRLAPKLPCQHTHFLVRVGLWHPHMCVLLSTYLLLPCAMLAWPAAARVASNVTSLLHAMDHSLLAIYVKLRVPVPKYLLLSIQAESHRVHHALRTHNPLCI